MHLAAWNGRLEMARALVTHGAAIDVENDRGETPIAMATVYRHREVVKYLLERGARCDLFTAVALGKLDQIAARVEEQPELVHARNRYGATPLDWTQWTGLCTVEANSADVEAMLLGYGAKQDALAALARSGRWEDVAASLNADPGRIAVDGGGLLHRAIGDGRSDAVRMLLDLGAPMEAKGGEGVTPLHAAAWNGHKDVAELLVSRGANLNTRSNWNDSVLAAVVAQGWFDLAETMLARGAPPDIHVAAAQGHREGVAAFLQADPHLIAARDAGNRTPLHPASRWGRRDTVELLLQQGADVDARAGGKFGNEMMPLHLAARGGHQEVTRLLLQHGADVTAQDCAGNTPSDLATRAEHCELAAFLQEHGGLRQGPADAR